MNSEFEIYKHTRAVRPKNHIHENYEIFISLSNEGKLFISEEGYLLRFGSMFILKPFEIHRCSYSGVGNQDAEHYIIHFPEAYLEKLSTERTNLVSLFNSAPLAQCLEADTLAQFLGQLSSISKLNTQGFGDDVECNIRFSEFLLMLAREINDQQIIQVPKTENKNQLNEIICYIHRNYSKNISLECISKQFFISKSRLSQVFKDATGFSVGDYIITYRIKMACSLLKSGMRVKDVGEMVGFHTSTNFIRTFKKKMGFSPGEFSKKASVDSEGEPKLGRGREPANGTNG